ncbi:MAG: hypothetical protein KC933_33450, partial [Myxococcales bacterium]|nr:hypothetical protein [Myxococcales bacterium]
DPDAPPPEAVEGTALGATRPLPAAFWGAPSGLRCLDNVVQDVLREGYSHHITRLMVLGNLATLLDVSPRALTDWFWCMYTDAYDWVVEPNVLGMATYGLGPLFTTKPYVCGQAYLKKMSDACRRCDLADACPVTPLYWAFLERHRAALAENPRLALPLASAARRAPEARAADARVFEAVDAEARSLARGTVDEQAVRLLRAEVEDEVEALGPRFDARFSVEVDREIFKAGQGPAPWWKKAWDWVHGALQPGHGLGWAAAAAAVVLLVVATGLPPSPDPTLPSGALAGTVTVEQLSFEGNVTVMPDEGLTVVWLSDVR